MLLLSQVARGGFSDKVSFEHDMNEKKKPGIQKTQRENVPGGGNSEAQVCQGRSIWKCFKGLKEGNSVP